MRKKRKILLIATILCVCSAVIYMSYPAGYGNAGIYDLDGNLIISYNKLHKLCLYDVTKDYEVDSINSLSKILDRIGIEEDVVFVLPNVDRIGEEALSFTDNLVYCEIPDSLETIGAYAFYSSGLHEIAIPENVSEIDHNAFDSCRNMSAVVLNDGLKSIGVSAFRYEPNLTEITIPDSVEFIGGCAFQDTGLKYVRIPDTVETVEGNAFGNAGTVCYNGPTETYMGFGAENFHQFSDCNTCDLCGATLEYVPYMIESAEFIEDGVCNIPETFERNGVRYKVFSIATRAYKGNTELKELIIPNSVISIQNEVFTDCVNLEQVTWSNSLRGIGHDVFCNCTSLEEIIIPDSIETITGCFSGCANLREITLPKEIGLSTMDFEGCDNLTTVYYKGTEKEWKNKSVGAPAPAMSAPIDTLFEENVEIIFEK